MAHQKQTSHVTETDPEPEKEPRDKNENVRRHSPTPEEEESLDRTLEDSFPASDPPSSIPDPDADAA